MADPKKSLYRIWRDTRFSADKTAAQDQRRRRLPASRGRPAHLGRACISRSRPTGCLRGGGLYMPDPQGLHRIRERIAEDPQGFAARRQRPGLEACGGLQGESLKRCLAAFPPITQPPTT